LTSVTALVPAISAPASMPTGSRESSSPISECQRHVGALEQPLRQNAGSAPAGENDDPQHGAIINSSRRAAAPAAQGDHRQSTLVPIAAA
jgi:hypothetical protein